MIINANSLDYLKTLEDNSIDSVVTDPPYGLSFMGKKWDYDVPSKELWQEVLRVLKPGGHLLSFAGSRTYHRMAVNIEDAGFEIRDQIMWVYGSGFPKSLNIGKAVDKLQGNERETVGVSSKGVGGTSNTMIGGSFENGGKTFEIDKGNSPYEGWGTALKPAHEPIVVARKPISEKSIAENTLKWGTGGINIDGSRVGTETLKAHSSGKNALMGGITGDNTNGGAITPERTGRFPANFIHDGSDKVVGLLGEPSRFFYSPKAGKSERNKGLEEFATRDSNYRTEYRPTASDSGDKGQDTPYAGTNRSGNVQNHHPTVKPIKLMQYLVKLVTPKDGTVLDPFNGSGTTGIAAKLENFNYIGIELDPEYVAISEARIEAWEADKQEKLI